MTAWLGSVYALQNIFIFCLTLFDYALQYKTSTTQREKEMTISANAIEKITNAAFEIMAKRASNLAPGEKFSTQNIVNAVISDPSGETAHYLANLIKTGVEHYGIFI